MMKAYKIEFDEQVVLRNWFMIYFKIEDVLYGLNIAKPLDGSTVYTVHTVYHVRMDQFCPVCHSTTSLKSPCSLLVEDLKTVTEYLLSHNSIRLEWLFRDIVWQDQNVSL